jgi:hypothetical protein
MEETNRVPISPSTMGSSHDIMTLAKALDLLKTKDVEISSLQNEMRKLRCECEQKSTLISQQTTELQRLREKDPDTFTLSDMDDAFVEQNLQNVDKVVGDLTNHILQRSPLAKRTRRSPIIPNTLPTIVTRYTTNDTIDLNGTQDSLSFPVVPSIIQLEKDHGLQEENKMLRRKLAELTTTYYHWKVACILSVDRSQQVAKELEKVSRNFVANAPKRENGLTSWALLEDMFPNNMCMVELPQKEVIDWSKNGWDHENQMSSHIEEKKRMLLWPKPAPFVLDHTKCPICLEQFGPEGGWALGSCAHVYHPQCLITQCLIRRRCVICSTPFHDRLYTMFNLTTYMPPSWEHTRDTTADTTLWGRDLVWSWREGQHDQEKGPASSQLNWETDPDEIARVAPRLMGKGPQNEGRRAFFFQCLGGYWDKTSSTFKWGPHPQRHRWNLEGERVANQDDSASLEDLTSMAYLDSTYGPYYQSQALDYLLEAHSPQTTRTLQALQDSNVLQSILKADGPASRTRAKRKLGVGEASTYEEGEGSGSQNNPNVID